MKKYLALAGIAALASAGLAFAAGEQEAGAAQTVDLSMWLSVDVSPDQLWGGPGASSWPRWRPTTRTST